MTPSRALVTCAELERRAAAAVRAANAKCRRTDDSASEERDLARSVRAAMSSEPAWTSALCAIIHVRSRRTEGFLQELARRGALARRRLAESESHRRRWARIVRGLERRAAHAAEQEPSWDD